MVRNNGTLFQTTGVLDEMPLVSPMAIDALKDITKGIEIVDTIFTHSGLKKDNAFLAEVILPVKGLHYFIQPKGFIPVSASTFADICKDHRLLAHARIFG